MSGKSILDLEAEWEAQKAKYRQTEAVLKEMGRAANCQLDDKRAALRSAWEQARKATEDLFADGVKFSVAISAENSHLGEYAHIRVEKFQAIKLRVSDARTIAAWLTALADRVEGKA